VHKEIKVQNLYNVTYYSRPASDQAFISMQDTLALGREEDVKPNPENH
jgi:hypothetical protein